ncbi:alpha/beta hydrolase [Mesorhizobium sp. ES1-1]|uniref:alpha/beta hydrolase n=1 Tax=Mesorhizobium sp. ES1-1 TaxID=2876629 RepID=UPI001CCAA1AB|nr:alpha/beta hydrolase [Mesorhizobium sp. ES1-1]MBZ9676942.1 alpha/beta hydrolase [Mesorhizobium sp. ES1-1]
MANDPFRIRDYVPDFDHIVADIVARSAATRATLPMVADIGYGSHLTERLDLFFPKDRSRNLPVHMFIHGGYWRMFSKSDYSYVADTVTSSGAIAVIIDYALMPSVRMATIVDQVRRAKQWVLDNISTYGGDPDCFTISGHSAGAHLATMLFDEAGAPSKVRAALLLGGLYDLEPLQNSFLAAEISITDQEVAAFSPLTHEFDRDVHVSILVGGEETPPFHLQAQALAARLETQGLVVERIALPGSNHMSSVRDLGVAGTREASLLMRVVGGIAAR